MLLPHLQPVISAVLEPTLDDAGFQKIAHFLAEEYLLLDLHWVRQPLALHYFVAGFKPRFVEHFEIAVESFHHGFEQPAIEHECWFVD